MFKVECPSCSVPYQVDERRVPAQGLNMRCPKCRTSFVVQRPGAPLPAGVKAIDFKSTSIGVSAPTARRSDNSSTMIGVAAPGAGSVRPRAPWPAKNRSLSGTMIGLAGPGASSPASPRRSAGPTASASPAVDLPALPTAQVRDPREVDLPAVAKAAGSSRPNRRLGDTGSPAAGFGLPAPSAKPPKRDAFPPSPRGRGELPAVLGGLLADPEADRPTLSSSDVLQAQPQRTPAADQRKVVPRPEALRPPARLEQQSGSDAAQFADLADVLDEQFDRAFDAALDSLQVDAPPSAAEPLPSLGPAQLPSLELDDLPSLKPQAGAASLDDFALEPDLPSVKPDLPSLRTRRAASLDDFALEPDLPSLRPQRAASLGGFALEPDLPSLRPQREASLRPASEPSSVEPQSVLTGDGALSSFTSEDELEIEDLPLESIPPSGSPAAAPKAQAFESWGDFEAERPAGDELPSPAQQSGTAMAEEHFGEIELPLAGQASLPSIPITARHEEPPDLDVRSRPGPSSKTGPASRSVSAPNTVSGEFDAFDELPDFDDFAISSRSDPQLEQAAAASAGRPGSGRSRASLTDEHPSSGSFRGGGEEFEPPQGAVGVTPPSLVPNSSPGAVEALRGAADEQAGGLDYGAVDLGGDQHDGHGSFAPGAALATSEEDEMEFAAIPQEKPERVSAAAGPGLDSSKQAPVTSGTTADVELTRSKSRAGKGWRFKWFAAAAASLALASGGLALVPEIGPLGIYAASDWLRRSAHEELLLLTIQQTVQQRAADDYASVAAVDRGTHQAVEQAKRFAPLQAYRAYTLAALALRFDGLEELQSRAAVFYERLTERQLSASEVPELRLAQAALHALEGRFDQAQQLLRAPLPKALSVDAATLLGEIELRRDAGAAAEAAFAGVTEQRTSAWVQFGLARAAAAAAKPGLAIERATQLLEAHPNHVGARLLLVDQQWALRQVRPAAEHLAAALQHEGRMSPAQRVRARAIGAQMELERGRLARAEALFEQALQVDPKHVESLIGLGETLYGAGRSDAALARFQAASSLDQGSKAARLGAARAHLALDGIEASKQQLAWLKQHHPKDAEVAYFAGRVAEREGESALAQQQYELALQSEPTEAVQVEATVALARSHQRQGRDELATELLERAQQQLPQSLQLHRALGELSLERGQLELALQHLRRAHELAPEDLGVVFRLGSALRRMGRLDEAATRFEQVARVEPELPGLALERGLMLEQSGSTAEALREYEAALGRAPEDADLMLRVGCGRLVLGDGPGAEPVLRSAVQLRPRSAEAHHCLGRALASQGHALEALKLLKRAVDLDPHQAQYLLHLGWVASSVGQVALAERMLSAAVERDQGLADAHWQRGVLRLKQGAAASAIEDLRRALQVDPTRYEAHADLAQAYYQLGRQRDALEQWKLALAKDDTNPTWLFRYGRALHRQRDYGQAATHLVRAIELSKEEAPLPAWFGQAHYLAAHSLGSHPSAIEHWKQFLEHGSEDSPYRKEAERALQRAGAAL